MGRDSGTVRAAKTKIAIVTEPVFRLSVVAGPDGGKELSLDARAAPRVLLGTSPACELHLTDRQVSRRHLAVELDGGVVSVRDLGSTNGTRVNGVRIGEVFLQGGETLELGETRILLQRGEGDGPPLISDRASFGRYLGHSVAMRKLYPVCDRLAASDVPVLVEGETGTGKELLAEALHEASPRASAPFVVLDCAGTPAAEVEGLLFGRGETPGLVEEAAGGTLVIDEIGELSPELQPRLLRAIDRREIRRSGGTAVIPVDVRLVATTRRNLDRAVTEGAFRDDLFFRIAVARIELPPLRKRREDVELLARHFWRGEPTDDLFRALERMSTYEWPGNVRELANFVSRLRALGDLPAAPREEPAPAAGRDFIDAVIGEHLPLGQARDRIVEEFERRYVEDAFVRNGNNVTKAAAAAGIARRYFRALRARQRE